jgi:hypothetical protein
LQTDGFNASGTQIGDLNASGVDVQIVGNETKIYSNNLQVARVATDSAVLGSLNVAGVRLTIRQGRIEGLVGQYQCGHCRFIKFGDRRRRKT